MSPRILLTTACLAALLAGPAAFAQNPSAPPPSTESAPPEGPSDTGPDALADDDEDMDEPDAAAPTQITPPAAAEQRQVAPGSGPQAPREAGRPERPMGLDRAEREPRGGPDRAAREPRGGPDRAAGRQARAERQFQRMDRNDDGYVDRDEIERPRTRRFNRFDRDRDGQLDARELAAARARIEERAARRGREPGRDPFTRFDRDQNGVITLEEWLRPVHRAMAFADGNRDGRISHQEMETALERRANR